MADPFTITGTAASVVSLVEQSLIARIKRYIKRALNAERNLDDLKKQVEFLKNEKEKVQGLVDEARDSQGREIHPYVENWLTNKVEPWTRDSAFTEDEGNAKKRCFIGLCPNYLTHYRTSVKVEEGAKEVAELLEEAARYDAVEKISHHPLQSRTSFIEQTIDALTASGTNMVGVYGMGGVGKTTLVKVVAAQVLEKKFFDKVVIVSVTAKPNIEKIQEEIAESLGMKLEEKSERVRASRLKERLKNEKKILIVLDDLWERLDLDLVGIQFPDQGKGFKILMTSRNENVLSREMGAKKTFQLQVLSEVEAWNLFESMVGGVVEDNNVRSVAIQVCKRCAGLPVLLAAVARALKGANIFAWRNVLKHLARFDNSELDAQISSVLELSYELLKGDEIKSLFRLFGQLRSGSHSIRDLLKYTTGLGLIKGSNTIAEVRDGLHKLLDDLKASCLLLEGDFDGHVKMHDVVHNFAISLASKDNHVFRVAEGTIMEEWPAKDKLEQYAAVSLPYCRIPGFPTVLDCPKVEAFLLLQSGTPSMKIPDNLFRGMTGLKLMDLTGMYLSPLPYSLEFLTNLQTLCLDFCVLDDIAAIGQLQKLQVLSLISSDIIQLPREIGLLTQLKLLDLDDCRRLKVIPPDVLSCLTQLENLYMKNVILQWEVNVLNRRKENASLAELMPLPILSTLDILILDAKMLPNDLSFAKLERFKILIGHGWDWSGRFETQRTLKLKLNASTQLGEGIKMLLKISEDLYLSGPEGVKDALNEVVEPALSELKHLNIQNSLEIEHLIHPAIRLGQSHIVFPGLETLFLDNLSNLKEICYGKLEAGSFSKLKVLKVGNCDGLKYLISFSMARVLLQLEEIEIFGCKIMEEIASQQSEDDSDKDENIMWRQLRSLTLQDLPQFKTFCSEVKVPLMSETRLMLSFTDGRTQNVHEDEPGTSVPPPKRACFPRLVSFFSTSKPRQMEHGTNFGTDEIVRENLVVNPGPLCCTKIVFPHLEELKLSFLKIENLWDSRLIDISSCSKKLTSLIVKRCDNVRSLFTYSMVKSLSQLKKVEISDCKLLEEVIVIDEGLVEGDLVGEILFPQLDFLKLKGLQQLVRFCICDLLSLSSLKSLWIESCLKLKSFVSTPAETANMMANIETAVTDSTLFDQKVAFPKLEELQIVHMDTLRKIWHDQLHGDSFIKLKTLNVEHAAELQNVFPSKIERRFQNLENLLISDCDSLIELFDMNSMVVTQLRTLRIRGLPSLKSLFPVSIATMQLCLEEIEVTNCGIEEIVTKPEGIELRGVPMFQFPYLTYLQLWNLSKLKGFYSGRHMSEWPMLKRLTTNYGKMAIFDWKSQRSEEASCLEIQPFFSAQKVIPNLQELSLNSKDVEIICHSQVSADLFFKVNRLRLQSFHDKSTIFPVRLLQRYFYNLESLLVGGCSFKEMVYPDEQTVIGNQGTAFPHMRFLRLDLIHNLEQFWKQVPQLDCLLKNLETLHVWQCHGLTNLSLLSSSFHTLITLDVSKCDGLVNIFTPLMAKCLVQLTEIRIRECSMVRVIVANEGDDTEDAILFTKLETLEFSCLPRLTSFYPGSCRIKFQSLVKVIVKQCPRMRTFSTGVTSTPKLQEVQITEDEDESHWAGDLNATIQQLHKEWVGFRGLKNLKLSEFHELRDLWHTDFPVGLFSDLRSLIVDGCPFFSSALSPALLPVLKDLEKLEVENCHSLEGILDLEKLNDGEEKTKLLPGLRELCLTDLPTLGRLWDKASQAIFKLKNLCVLKVYNCSSLRNIFTESVAEGFKKLKTIEIRNCAVMEAIIMADIEEAPVGKVVIPALESLVLCSLPNLTSMYRGSGILELPSLKEIIIDCCPKVNAFVSSTSRPRILDEEAEQTLLVGDADDSIALLFDDKVEMPDLERMEILNMDNLERIWDKELHPNSFFKLNTLKVKNAKKLSSIFPPTMPRRFDNLEEMDISKCDSLEELFDKSSMLVPAQLRILYLRRLPNLKSLFLAFISTMRLHLEKLVLVDCGIEEIIMKREETGLEEVPVFRFPQLTFLRLWNLSKLKGFYSGRHISEWPRLKIIRTNLCMETSIFDWESQSFREECFNSQVDASLRQPFFSAKEVIPKLEELTLNGKDIAMVSNGQVPTGLFREIKFLRLVRFHGESAWFPIILLERNFSNLETLHVVCSSFEEMSSQDGLTGEENQGIVSGLLRYLRLDLIHNLKQFCRQNSRLDYLLTNLETLEVWHCHDLTNLAPLSASFRSLTTLDIDECDGLLNLFTSSMAKSLVQLTKMSIKECAMVTEIVANGGDATEDEIILSSLETLELRSLPFLTSFCLENHSVKFPSLVEVVVRQCPKMWTFSRGDLSTPELQNVQFTEDGDEDCWEGDLNATILKLHKELVQAVLQLDSETHQAEKDDIFSPIDEGAAEVNLELEAKSITELTTEEQDAVPNFTQPDSRCQVSDAPSNDRVTQFIPLKYDEAVSREELPFSSKQPFSNSVIANAEKKVAIAATEEPSFEKLCAIENPVISEDLHQEIEATSEAIVKEEARKENMTRPETAQYVPADEEVIGSALATKSSLKQVLSIHDSTRVALPEIAEASLTNEPKTEGQEEDHTTAKNVETDIPLEAQKEPQLTADWDIPAQQGLLFSAERASGEKPELPSNINQPVIKSASTTQNFAQEPAICAETTVALTTTTTEPSLTNETQVRGEVIEAALSIDSEAEVPPHDGVVAEPKPFSSPGQSSVDFATTRADHHDTITLSQGLASEYLSSFEHPWFASMQKSKLLMDWLNSKSKTLETTQRKADLREAVKIIEDCLSHTVAELNERKAYDSIEAALQILAAPSTPEHLATILKVTAKKIAIYKEKLPKAQSVIETHHRSLDNYSTKHSTLSNGIEKQKAAMAELREEVKSLIVEDQDVSKKIAELLAQQMRIRSRLALATEKLEQVSKETESLIGEDESAKREMEVEDEYLDASRLIDEAEGTFLKVRNVLNEVKSFYKL